MVKLLEQEVRHRARDCCEYCLLPQSALSLRHVVDHIIASQHHGTTALENLALACGRCNLRKGPNIAGIDPETKTLVRLFNPRTDTWSEHFVMQGATLIGITGVGRATVDVLDMNGETRRRLRLQLILTGRFPPGS
jgi:hypothetical protein